MGRKPGRHAAKRRFPLWFKIVAAVSALLFVGVVAGTLLLWQLQSNLKVEALNAGLGAQDTADAQDGDPMQVLVMGSDTRAGQAAELGGTPSESDNAGTQSSASGYGNADVMMLVDISANGERVNVVSFPRDLMVPFPGCRDPRSGEVFAAQESIQINSTLALAGPGCAVATVNGLTGMTIDHFMLADFAAVTELSTVLGGVDVCVSQAVNDPASGLNLPAGTSSVSGDQALAFLRTRHAFGDGSDLNRIQAQQSFLATMVRKIKDEGTLSNVPKLYQIADVITKNLTVDEGLGNTGTLIAMANRLKNVDLSQVSFITAPTIADPNDPNRVVLQEQETQRLFTILKNQGDITGGNDSPTNAASEPAGPSSSQDVSTPAQPSQPAPTFDRAQQSVSVVNASDAAGRDVEIVNLLTSAGYSAAFSAGAILAQEQTQIRYDASPGSTAFDVAQDIAAQLAVPASAVVPAATGELPAASVQLVIGTDFGSGERYGDASALVGQTAQEPTRCQQVNNLPR